MFTLWMTSEAPCVDSAGMQLNPIDSGRNYNTTIIFMMFNFAILRENKHLKCYNHYSFKSRCVKLTASPTILKTICKQFNY